MCLIAIAINTSRDLPLVIAANRDEAYDRPSLRAHRWTDAPHILGGRDVTHGGSWLAVSCEGRFAAVTNIRGAMTKEKSRGLLVRDFVFSGARSRKAGSSAQYAGFNLITGTIGGPAILTSNADNSMTELESGIYALGNDAPSVSTPKLTRAVEAMRSALESPHLVRDLMRFLQSPDAFVKGDRYGTRSSTVIVATRDNISLTEQVPDGETVELRCQASSTAA